MAEDEVVEVVVEDVSYRSDDGRFAVLRVERTAASPEDASFVAVGDVGDVRHGETLRLVGRFGVHPTHGRRFEIRTFTPVLPTTEEGLVKMLSGIPGVGPSLASGIVKRFGTRTLDVVTNESEKLKLVHGVGKSRAKTLRTAVLERRAEAENLTFLHGVGLGPALAKRVLTRYGNDAARRLRDDPYVVAEELPGVGFTTVDQIGRKVGIGVDDPRRVAGVVLHLVGRAADEGHTYLTAADLGAALPTFELDPAALGPVLARLERERLLAFEGDAVYAPPILAAERRLAERLRALTRGARAIEGPPTAAEGLSAEQADAVEASLGGGVLLLTGGPGTGKTTTVRALVAAHVARGRRVVLAAPTGRAAKRLADASGHEAKTLHRLLEWNPGTGGFARGEDHPLDADLVLVDESSMMDVRLADRLVAAVPEGATLVLVGDADQLPPVGPGHVFREMLGSGALPTVRLTRIFRQAEQSAIVRAAHEVREGRAPTASPRGVVGSGEVHYVAVDVPEELEEKLRRVLDRIAATYGLDPKDDVQVLSPMRKGPFGTDALNAMLQRMHGMGASAMRFHVGDRVMQLRNDYDKDVYNGDVGEVLGSREGALLVRVDGRTVRYAPDELDDLTLAYACTVHKVQGSEFPAVVLVLHGAHHVMLARTLLYTAITRAKRLVVLLGTAQAVARAARHDEAKRARCRLGERLTSSAP